MNVTRKLGMNRGKRRLWLQGAILSAAGFKPGDRYYLTSIPQQPSVRVSDSTLGVMVMTLKTRDPLAGQDSSTRRVSGKGDLPIIDIIGAAISNTFPARVTEVQVVAHAEARTIVVTGVKA